MEVYLDNISRRKAGSLIFGGLAATVSFLQLGEVNAAIKGTVFKSPSCGCCAKWVSALNEAGIELTVKDLDSIAKIKQMLRVPVELQSCHTAVIGRYVIEGHVPPQAVKRLLSEKPKGIGLAVPGMPIGSVGMEQDGRKDPYDVILFDGDRQRVYAQYREI